jgi:hypothetical protein
VILAPLENGFGFLALGLLLKQSHPLAGNAGVALRLLDASAARGSVIFVQNCLGRLPDFCDTLDGSRPGRAGIGEAGLFF